LRWAIWTALGDLGFDGGWVLEPGVGSGTFIGMAPDSAEMVGVELDPTTAAIAAALYPDATIRIESFADTPYRAGHFDATVGNMPFADVRLHDPRHNRGGHSLHNDEGGGGYLERFAQGLGAKAAESDKTISQTILDELREDYDQECWAVSPDNERSHLGGPKGRLPAMTFEEILGAAHWTPAIFAAIDTEVERQRRIQEDMAVQAHGGQLDLFAIA
jgi:hypothetical protein